MSIYSSLDSKTFGSLSFSNSILCLDFGFLTADNLCFLVSSLGLFLDNNSEYLKFLFEFGDILTSGGQFDDTSLVLISLVHQLTLLLAKHVLEELDQFEEGLRSSVDWTSLLNQDLV